MVSKRILLAAVTGLLLCAPLSAPAWAQAAAPTRIRGTIEKVEGAVVAIRSRGGDIVSINLAPDAKVTAARKTTMAEVKPGSYIGTATMRQPDGSRTAMEVTVFPPAMAGTGEGSFAWDLAPGSTMTNGSVADLVSTNGHTMTVKYKGGSDQVITVPEDAPVVVLVPDAGRDLLKPGAAVFVVPTKANDGTLVAARITVGENGTVPPM